MLLSDMNFDQVDVNGLLSFLERDLRARDSWISELKSEKSLEHLYCAKYNQLDFCDTDKRFTNKNQSTACQNNPLLQLEDLIITQHKAQLKIKEHIKLILEKHQLACTKLELEHLEHDCDSGENVRIAIKLIEDREKLNLELQNIRCRKERLEGNLKKLEEATKIRHEGVINKLVKRRKEIQKELHSDCQRCVQLENRLDEVRNRVITLRTRLDLTKDEVFKSIQNISEPFHEQVRLIDDEFGVLRSKISRITSSNDEVRLKIKKFKEKNQFFDVKITNSAEGQPNFDKSLDVSNSVPNSLLDTFDMTIKMLEKEIENSKLLKNLNNHSSDLSRVWNSVPHTTPLKSSTIRANPKISQKITNFECLMNSSNINKMADQQKQCHISSIPADVLPVNLTPFNSVSGTTLISTHPSSIVNHNNATKIPSPINSFNTQSKDSPPAPPPSLSASPICKKSPLSPPVGRSKQLPPPPPAKPGLKSPQGKSLTIVKHLIMPSKTS